VPHRSVASHRHDSNGVDRHDSVEPSRPEGVARTNRRLSEALEASRRELRESRARIQSAADTERRRIERDLHDGAQQRLVRLRIKLELARETVDRQGGLDSEVLQTLGDDVVAIIDEIRSLARGVYPHLLDDGGPAEALRSVAGHAAFRATVVAPDLPRYAADVEAAIYFCCLEALQNVSKHATGARNVAITLAPGPLRFEIRDDGPGFDANRSRPGAGLDNMRDRMAAVGGRLDISSAPGRGTIVRGSIARCDPLPA
jgi:signal transduction histidine kinase